MDESHFIKIAERIKEIRFKKGYSQEYMANELGISQNIYSRNERDVKKMSLGRLCKIAAILDTTAANLLTN
ncbi:helix-turn-helix domain-containing protein [Pedobacter sandarakinus]|uniref:helix-turn-helix domain-containing protein n=1 Tax=Pedobacter sandarakinus TaxID=353156 RepID=UPI0022461525|nr:helix-turn-helix transcriptional regulator [Pedobacter sandarakinus]MCX2576095.1 helix-turn-helix transcriptional regulator [Pedobacter sandarakinus]